MLYGMMTEEINYSYDGGLYAEMVRNRSFTDRGWAGIGHWNVDNTGTALAVAKYDATTGPSDALVGSMRIDVTSANTKNPAGVRNDGWWGMSLHPDTTYQGSLYARSENGGSIGVSLVSDLTGKQLASTTVTGLSSDWKQYPFTLKTGGPGCVCHQSSAAELSADRQGLDQSCVVISPHVQKSRQWKSHRPDGTDGGHASQVSADAGRQLPGGRPD